MSSDQRHDDPLRRSARRALAAHRRLNNRLRLSLSISLFSIVMIGFLWSAALHTSITRVSTWWAGTIPAKWVFTALLVAALLYGSTLTLRTLLQRARKFAYDREVARIHSQDNERRLAEPSEQELGERVAESRRKRIESRGIAASIIVVISAGLAAGSFVYATTPEISNRPPSRSTQSIQSAALVSALLGGAVTIWLSNRRRRHDEATLEQGREELGLNRQRAEEERFSAAIELLGHDDSSVRVGALHVLHGLATTAPPRRQTVVDVMSAYLRLPFWHHSWTPKRSVPDVRKISASDREREVRRTALRLVVDLVKQRSARSMGPLLVDLAGAHLDELDLEHAFLELHAPGARFHGEVNLRQAGLYGTRLQGSVFYEELHATNAAFLGVSTFAECRFERRATFDAAHFERDASFHAATFVDRAFFQEAVFSGLTMAKALFLQYASFGEASFWANSDFDKVEFGGASRFAGVKFRHAPGFAGSAFRGDTTFATAIFEGGADFKDCTFGGVANFSDTTIRLNRRQFGISFYRSKFEGQFRLPDANRPFVMLDSAVFSDEGQRPSGADQKPEVGSW